MNKPIVLTVVIIFVIVCIAMINIKILHHEMVGFMSSRDYEFMAPGGGGGGQGGGGKGGGGKGGGGKGGGGKGGGGKGGGGKGGGGKGKGKQPPDNPPENPPPDNPPPDNPPDNPPPPDGCQPANTTHYPGMGYIDNNFLAALKK